MSTSRRYSRSYSQLRSRTAKPKKGSFSLFKNKRNNRARISSQSDSAESLFYTRPASKRLSRESSPSVLPSKKTLLGVLLIGILSAWAWLLFFFPYFDLTNVKITGLKNIKNEEIDPLVTQYLSQKSWNIFKNKNYFTFSAAGLSSELKKHFYVDDIQILPSFPNNLTVNVVERASSIIYDNGSSYYILDQSGTVVKLLKDCTDECIASTTSQIMSTENNPSSTTSTATTIIDTHKPKYDSFALEYLNVPVVYDQTHQSVSVSQAHVVDTALVTHIITIASTLRKLEKNFAALYYILAGPGSGVAVVTDKGYLVYLNPDNDLASQLQYVDVVLRDNKPTNYIDVRYTNRVFWK